eukprot:11307927-Alexandrium_andersonii.AAC.1
MRFRQEWWVDWSRRAESALEQAMQPHPSERRTGRGLLSPEAAPPPSPPSSRSTDRGRCLSPQELRTRDLIRGVRQLEAYSGHRRPRSPLCRVARSARQRAVLADARACGFA